MRNIIQANAVTHCCEKADIRSAGFSRPIPGVRHDPVWRQFQSSVVQAFVRRHRREALRARLIEQAINAENTKDE